MRLQSSRSSVKDVRGRSARARGHEVARINTSEGRLSRRHRGYRRACVSVSRRRTRHMHDDMSYGYYDVHGYVRYVGCRAPLGLYSGSARPAHGRPRRGLRQRHVPKVFSIYYFLLFIIR